MDNKNILLNNANEKIKKLEKDIFSLEDKLRQWKEKFNKLEEDIKADICVIGGGLTGLSTAYYLSKLGKKVALLERDKICSHTSVGTTGKITSQHGLFYDDLIKDYGEEYAHK